MYRTAKSTRMAHPGQIGLPGSGKTPSRKRSRDGRFVQYLCEKCEDSGSMGCPTCDGSGIGMHGDPDTSRCLDCKGSGSVPCDGEAHEGE